MKQNIIEEYDKQNGTELARFVAYLERGKKLNEGESRYFKVGITGDMLNKYGMSGKISIGISTFNRRHSDVKSIVYAGEIMRSFYIPHRMRN